MKLVDQAEVLKLLRRERDEWKAEKRHFHRFTATWHRADTAVLIIEGLIRDINKLETK